MFASEKRSLVAEVGATVLLTAAADANLYVRLYMIVTDVCQQDIPVDWLLIIL